MNLRTPKGTDLQSVSFNHLHTLAWAGVLTPRNCVTQTEQSITIRLRKSLRLQCVHFKAFPYLWSVQNQSLSTSRVDIGNNLLLPKRVVLHGCFGHRTPNQKRESRNRTDNEGLFHPALLYGFKLHMSYRHICSDVTPKSSALIYRNPCFTTKLNPYADYKSRTRDFLITSEALYQLS